MKLKWREKGLRFRGCKIDIPLQRLIDPGQREVQISISCSNREREKKGVKSRKESLSSYLAPGIKQ